MEIKPRIITVSEGNTRYKKRTGFRNQEVVYKALFISGLLFTVILLAIKYGY